MGINLLSCVFEKSFAPASGNGFLFRWFYGVCDALENLLRERNQGVSRQLFHYVANYEEISDLIVAQLHGPKKRPGMVDTVRANAATLPPIPQLRKRKTFRSGNIFGLLFLSQLGNRKCCGDVGGGKPTKNLVHYGGLKPEFQMSTVAYAPGVLVHQIDDRSGIDHKKHRQRVQRLETEIPKRGCKRGVTSAES
jgi:hypothetical protein